MGSIGWVQAGSIALHVLVQAGLIVRVLLRPHREPASRLAWIVVILAAPVVGIVAYLLLGETSIGRARERRFREVKARLERVEARPDGAAARAPGRYEDLFRVAGSINGFEPVGGNTGELTRDSDATIDRLVEDIDGATDHVHLIFYIWLEDGNGRKVAEALMRAAARGVTCRAMADALGSRALIRSALWRRMGEAGVRLAAALPVGNVLLRPLRGRIDLRVHQKIVVIDDRITFCGSQNCADPAFLVKAKYAPWVDAVMRFEGPVARQQQWLFASLWMEHVDEDLGELLERPIEAHEGGVTALAFGTGPTVRASAMPEMFETMMYGARRELVITTPYYVPTESMQAAVCGAGRRGVSTTIVFPARCDSRVVAAASRSTYAELLEAGVRIHEYVGGLLHTKSMAVDGEALLIGSANMDRRSFELNYENNILLVDEGLTGAMRSRQDEYLASSREVTLAEVEAWPAHRRLVNNTVAMLGPVL